MKLPSCQHLWHSSQFSQASFLFSALRWSETHDRRHRRSTHPENFRVRIFDLDPDWKSLRNPDPVKVSFYKWQPLDLDIIFLGLYRWRNALDDSLKTSVGIRQEINLGSHARTYVLEFPLAKVCQYIPLSRIQDRTNLN